MVLVTNELIVPINIILSLCFVSNFINVFIRSNNIGFVGEKFEKKVQSKPGKISTFTKDQIILFYF